MPPSQLKQLKASLRESGVVGPQQSKKQKRQNAKSGVGAQNRNQRNAALQAIRDRFNPFEIRPTATRSKFETTTRDDNSKKATGRRPGVTKSLGEERVSLLLSICNCAMEDSNQLSSLAPRNSFAGNEQP
jgi:nucleolar protein 14